MNRSSPDTDELLSHAKFVRGLARALLGDEQRADDAVQETYLAALAHPPDRLRPLRPWLAAVVRNMVRRDWRQQRRRERRERAAARPETQPSFVDRLEREEALRRVVEGVLSLDLPYRDVVLLHYYEGLGYGEVAERLSVSVETVRSRLKRARSKLRARLGERDDWAPALVALVGAELGPVKGLVATGGVIMGAQAKWAVVLCVVAILFGVGLWGVFSTGSVPAVDRAKPRTEIPASAEKTPRTEPGDAPEPAAPEIESHYVRGTVRDEAGNPVAGAQVFVGAGENPFEGQPTAGLNDWWGRLFTTDDQGGYEVRFDRRRRVLVAPRRRGRYRPLPRQEGWIDTPAEGVDFVIGILPVATLAIRVNDAGAGGALRSFTCRVSAAGVLTLLQADDETAQGEVVLPLAARDGPVPVRIDLSSPPQNPEVAEELELAAGDHREVTLWAREAGSIRGLVVDSDGRPLENALVFFGTQRRARGDDAFEAFDAEKVGDGVRTNQAGVYELRGDGAHVTAWHPDHSPATVPVSESSRIALLPRGAIRGRVLDASGAPAAGIELRLDGAVTTKTAGDGTFAFVDVEAGTRGIRFADRSRIVGVQVRPGETSKIELRPGLPLVRIEVTQGGNPTEGSFTAGIAGEGDVYLVRVGKVRDGVLELTGVWPGRYLFIGEDRNYYGWLTIKGERVQVDLGGAALRVHGRPGARFSVVPHGIDEQVRKVALKLVRGRVPESGTLVFAPLPAGRYEIWSAGPAPHLQASVRVDVDGAEVSLDEGG